MSFSPIAIVGRGCVLPGALGPDALWRLVRSGASAITETPEGHWGTSADSRALGAETASRTGGYVTGFDRVFSPEGFRIPIDPALDPVFLWTLHAAREALCDAGRDVFRAPVRGAVILGNLSYPTPGMIRFALDVWRNRPPQTPLDRFMSGWPAALVAQAIGVEGPAFCLDAACASSLYAIRLACDKLADRSVDIALAGGVNHVDDLFLHLGFTALSALSPTGRSRPFHRDADGLVPATGAAVVLLKRLEDAESAGDKIFGIIRGVGLSNDGRSRGLLVPSESGQVRAMRAAYAQSGLSPTSVSLVECHATGTAVGDAVEARSLASVFAEARDVPLGSLKSNLGHLITASGAAALLKVLSAMEAGERPPSIHATPTLPDIAPPFRVLTEAEPWPEDRPRRAAISGFGFGGNNAHLIVDQASAPAVTRQAPQAISSSPWIYVASSPDQASERVAKRSAAHGAPRSSRAALHSPDRRILAVFEDRKRSEDASAGRAAINPRAARAKKADIAVTAVALRVGSARSTREVEACLRSGERLVEQGRARAEAIELDLAGIRFPPSDLAASLAQQTWILDAVLSLRPWIQDISGDRMLCLVGMQTDADVARTCLRFRAPDALAGRFAEGVWGGGAEGDRSPKRRSGPLSAALTVGCMPNMVANRLSQQLDLSAPGFTISAEEASGTVALEEAMSALDRGEVDAAIVAAVDLGCNAVSVEAARSALPEFLRAPADQCVALVLRRAVDVAPAAAWALLRRPENEDALSETRQLALGDGHAGLTPWWGHAHAASGLVHVAAAVLAVRGGFALPDTKGTGAAREELGPIAVRVASSAGVVTRVLVAPPTAIGTDPGPVPEDPPRAHPRSFPAHGPDPHLDEASTPPQAMPSPPALAPIARDVRARAHFDAAEQAPSAAGSDWQFEAARALRHDGGESPPHPSALRALTAHHEDLAEMHQAFVRRQTDSHLQFLRTLSSLWRSARGAAAVRGPSKDSPRPRLSTPPAPEIRPARAEEGPTSIELASAQTGSLKGRPGPQLSRGDLERLASGPISEVLGPVFREQDAFSRVVRMPEPPLLLADRVLGIAGEAGSMGLGTIWTETDIRWDAWYLHEGRMPAGILIESGQADLLLISWLGVDRLNRGERVYRLLGCDLTSFGPLPGPGDTLSYEIHVDGHAAQGDVRLFFFHYDCRVNGELRVQVRNGQAGFFTDEELAQSQGVLFAPEQAKPTPDPRLDSPVVVSQKRAFSAEDIEAFIAGKARACFGAGFERADTHTRTPSIQGGSMRLFDEVTHFDPTGGPWKRGYLRARLALRPDHWFYKGHFKNDPCMPGTLMFEGSLQTMAVYLAALGFTLDRDGFRFEPVQEHMYRLRCRGQAIPTSKELVYELFVDEIHGGPNPVLFADLLGTVDGLKAFHCRRMGLKLVHGYPMDPGRLPLSFGPEPKPVAVVEGLGAEGASQATRSPEWQKRLSPLGAPVASGASAPNPFPFDQRSLIACAWGRPSDAFGPFYARFDEGVRVPRLPGPPYHFMSRITHVDGPIGGMQQGTTVTAEYDVPPDAWYFSDNGTRTMPFAVLCEIALQPCGWLASYVGCAVAAGEEVLFRNLDGTGTVERVVRPEAGTIRTTSRLTSIAVSGSMIIVGFEVHVAVEEGAVLRCNTVFGFFPPASMADQQGLPDGATTPDPPARGRVAPVVRKRAPRSEAAPRLPQGRLKMLGRVTGFWPEGGSAGLGRIRVARALDPGDWYFRSHFMRDPVQPGSLGIEGLVQALELAAIAGGIADGIRDPQMEALAPGVPITWKYRGQVIPENKEILLDVEISEVRRSPDGCVVVGEGSLRVDGKRIYHAKGLSARIVGARIPAAEKPEAQIDTSGTIEPIEAPRSEPSLFVVAGATREALSAGLAELAKQRASLSFSGLAGHLRDRRDLAPAQGDLPCAAVLVARDAAELTREIRRAETGIARAWETGETWRTPSGSVFAPRPIGPSGKVAFVYPGMGSATPGAARALFRQCPHLLADLRAQPGLAVGHRIATEWADIASGPDAEWAFGQDTLSVSALSMALSFAITGLLRDDLGVLPDMALGFSIGEGSMWAALGIWPDPALVERRLKGSDIFRQRLSGAMTAVREAWGLAAEADLRWSAAIVFAPIAEIRRVIAGEPRAAIMTVHTPREAMIGGEEEACHRALARLGAPSIRVPLALALHVPASLGERAALTALHRLEVAPSPNIVFYSSATCAPVPQTTDAIADHLASAYTSTVDFPALVERVYADGARVFVEAGAQSNGATWIDAILGEREHVCVPLLGKNEADTAGIARAIALLTSHRVTSGRAPKDVVSGRTETRTFEARESAVLPNVAPGGLERRTPKAIRSPDVATNAQPEEGPWTSLLAELAARLLGWSDPADVPRDEPLPLDSLAVMQLRARLEERSGLSLPAAWFFEHRTLARLAGALAEQGPPRAEMGSVGAEINGPERTSPARYRGAWSHFEMWHMIRPISSALPPAELHRRVPILWIRSRMGIAGPLDTEALVTALRATFAEHPILRSVIEDAPEEDRKIAAPPFVRELRDFVPEIPILEVSGRGRAEEEAFFAMPLDPVSGPPARLAIARRTSDSHEVWLHQHHLFTDGLSLLRFWQEVLRRYADPRAVEPKSPPFAAYCTAQQNWLSSEASAACKAYWTEMLAGVEPLRLPTDTPRFAPTDFRGERIAFDIPPARAKALFALQDRLSVGMFAVLLFALARTIQHDTGQEDLLFTTYHASRILPGFPGAFDVMGPLLSQLPLRLRMSAQASTRAALQSVHARVTEALEQGALPGDYMREAMGLPLPPPAACLMYQAFSPPSTIEAGPLRITASEPVGFGPGHASFELEIVCWPRGEGLAGVAAFSTQVFRRDTMERLVGRFLKTLEEIEDS